MYIFHYILLAISSLLLTEPWLPVYPGFLSPCSSNTHIKRIIRFLLRKFMTTPPMRFNCLGAFFGGIRYFQLIQLLFKYSEWPPSCLQFICLKSFRVLFRNLTILSDSAMLLSLYLFTSVPSLHANWKMENQISVYFKVTKNVTSQSAQSFTSLHKEQISRF